MVILLSRLLEVMRVQGKALGPGVPLRERPPRPRPAVGCHDPHEGVREPDLSQPWRNMATVSDEPLYTPGCIQPQKRPRNPAEHVRSLRKDGRQVDCALRFHRESYGWERQR